MIVFVTGGASCGKSTYAENMCMQLGGNLVYLAAMVPFGEEGASRVKKHRAQRAGKGFTTLECYEGLDAVLDDEALSGSTALLECLGNVVANEFFGVEEGSISQLEAARTRLLRQLGDLSSCCENLVIVGNEVGADGFSYAPETRAYQELLGAVACSIANSANAVVEVVAGSPRVLKGSL